MRLSDIVGASGLAGYAVAALILFLLAFVFVLVSVFAPGRRALHDRAAQIPFDDDGTPASAPGGSRR